MSEASDWRKAFDNSRKMNDVVKKLYDASKEFRDTDWGEKVTYINFNTFAELIVQECVRIVNEFGEDVENGDILSSTEKKLGEDVRSGHLGPILWRASELVKEHFRGKENE